MSSNGFTGTSARQDRPELRIPGPKGRVLVLKILQETGNSESMLRLLASEDYLTVYLEGVLHASHLPSPTGDDIRRLLTEARIQAPLDEECLEFGLRLLASERRLPPIEMAYGEAPLQGRNGQIEFLVKPSAATVAYKTDEKGNVDFRQTNRFENVLEKTRVARILPPTKGKPGTDVFGRPVAARDGEPIKIRLGSGVVLEPDENVIMALKEGRVVYEDDVLDVDETLIIHGDVDFSVGNIDFVGTVEVTGNVLDDFRVRAKKGISIRGDVGACEIISDGNIVILGGMAGRGRGKVVSANGAVKCHYFNDTTIQIDGNLVVEREIINSRVQCLGRLVMPRGAVIGGDIMASAGIEVRCAGSELGVRTRLEAGTDWRLQQELFAVRQELRNIDESVAQIEESVKPLVTDKGRILSLSGGQKQLLTTMLEQLKILREKRGECRARLDALEATVPKRMVRQINVLERLYAGVLVAFGDISSPVQEPMKGPLSAFPDANRGEAVFVGWQRLPEQ